MGPSDESVKAGRMDAVAFALARASAGAPATDPGAPQGQGPATPWHLLASTPVGNCTACGLTVRLDQPRWGGDWHLGCLPADLLARAGVEHPGSRLVDSDRSCGPYDAAIDATAKCEHVNSPPSQGGTS